MANYRRGTIYVGVTSDPMARLYQHRSGDVPGFTSRHALKRLVHIEFFGDMEHAIAREKQLKNWKRDWKIELIETSNPDWRDLALDYGFEPVSLLRVPDMDPGSSPG
jgi:putative endonuclease